MSVADNVPLRLVHLTRTFGKMRAVDDLSLEIPAGTFVSLLGPSGCGKSTTLNLIAGLDRPQSGTVLLGDRDLAQVPPNQRQMAMVFQNFALYPHMTAFDNIAFSLKLQHRPKGEIKTRVDRTAATLGITALLHRKPGQLSGGQQQRVALGRALVKEPLVFLFDEPFSNLDAALRARMRTEIKHLHQRLGTTSVFVTHDQEEAMTLSDFIAVMNEGRVVQFGLQEEIYTKPRNIYVATFVGKPKMSLLNGTLEHHDGSVEFVAPGLRIGLGPPAAIGLSDGAPTAVAAGVRAEDVKVVLNGSADPARSFGAAVGLLEPIGSDTFVELEVNGATIVARVPPDLPLEVGRTVQVEITSSRLHLFDRAGGDRIVD